MSSRSNDGGIVKRNGFDEHHVDRLTESRTKIINPGAKTEFITASS